jgi:hypothetical protein
MAVDTSGSNPNMDMQAHVHTYGAFIKFVQIGILLVALIVIGMAIFLT